MSNYSFRDRASCLLPTSPFVEFNMLAAKRKKTKSPNAGAFMVGSVSNIQTSLGVTKDAEPRQIFARIRSAQRFGGTGFGELTLFINRTPFSIHPLSPEKNRSVRKTSL